MDISMIIKIWGLLFERCEHGWKMNVTKIGHTIYKYHLQCKKCNKIKQK